MESKKAVGYILKKFPVLSETFILNEILELEARGIAVHIFSLERPNDPRFHENVPSIKATISYLPDFSKINTFLKYARKASQAHAAGYKKAMFYTLKNGKPSLAWRFLQSCYIANQVSRFNIGHFHAHFATRPTSVASITGMITGISYSFTAHAMDIFKTRLSTQSLRKKIEHASSVITISDYNKQLLSEVAPGSESKIVKIYNGINLARFKPNHEKSRKRFIFICVARFVEKKGHTILIDACERLRNDNVDFECWLVGKGNLRSLIKSKITEKALANHVKLLGPLQQGEVVERYKVAHCYVLPCVIAQDGNRDGLPVSIVEALASGLPVITTPVTGNAEVVFTDTNGAVVPAGDDTSLYESMKKIATDEAYYDALCKNTRASVEEKFDAQKTIVQLQELFEGKLGE